MTDAMMLRSLDLARLAKEKAEDAVTSLGLVASDGTEVAVSSSKVEHQFILIVSRLRRKFMAIVKCLCSYGVAVISSLFSYIQYIYCVRSWIAGPTPHIFDYNINDLSTFSFSKTTKISCFSFSPFYFLKCSLSRQVCNEKFSSFQLFIKK